jgi:hypothetical protein
MLVNKKILQKWQFKPPLATEAHIKSGKNYDFLMKLPVRFRLKKLDNFKLKKNIPNFVQKSLHANNTKLFASLSLYIISVGQYLSDTVHDL